MENSDDSFEIPVSYRGEEFSFPAQLVITGYTHKIQVEVDKQVIMYEPDEERNYRPVLTAAQLESGVKLDINLLKAIAEVIQSVIK